MCAGYRQKLEKDQGSNINETYNFYIFSLYFFKNKR